MVDYNPIYTTSESNQSVEYLKEKIQNLEFEIQQLENRKHDEQKEYMKNIEIQKIINHFKNNDFTITDIIDAIIEYNGIIGVGLISLGDSLQEYCQTYKSTTHSTYYKTM